MYEAFYGLREKPFYVTADPAFLYPSRHHQEAMDHLTYGIRERLGFLLVTGEVGTGKTTLAKSLVESQENLSRTALILNPALSGQQLLGNILRDFGVGLHSSRPTRGELLRHIENFLLARASQGEGALLIIDEAQALSWEALEQVRLLSNIESPKQKLLQIVLLGQPELLTRLSNQPRLRALSQRIAVSYQIQPLAEDEIQAYIDHRLRVAGSNGVPQFTSEAVALIAALSRGFPRRINLLCDHALLAGFVRESLIITPSLIKEAKTLVATGGFPEPVRMEALPRGNG